MIAPKQAVFPMPTAELHFRLIERRNAGSWCLLEFRDLPVGFVDVAQLVPPHDSASGTVVQTDGGVSDCGIPSRGHPIRSNGGKGDE